MARFPIVLTVISMLAWSVPSQAQDIRQATLANCLRGMEAVTAGHAQLQAIPQFYKAHAQQGSAFQPERDRFAVVALTEVEMAQQRRANLFEFDPAQGRLYLMAVPMTQVWTGLGCLHETTLAQILLEKATPNPSRTDYLAAKVQAFDSELFAADRITQGKFTQAIRQIQARRQYYAEGSVVTPNRQAQAALDRTFPQSAVLSPHERGFRDDFYSVALNFARLPSQTQRIAFLNSWYE
ncbi:hypothetical protein C1752_04059 [Acaryochloris thomasi RCC1774]|uniref:Uncharacterized protein n=1 Tax=Acaryochloris thomasi RCC1774 TaxID=1764569 RepID=A0A2W1JEI5_9CYAN|nr:hypothetical protein [Acaryochloris thomasi]PZD72088.1 hypothetical protein C1752_04059 [Acaryochloris thomasi RCC1774]